MLKLGIDQWKLGSEKRWNHPNIICFIKTTHKNYQYYHNHIKPWSVSNVCLTETNPSRLFTEIVDHCLFPAGAWQWCLFLLPASSISGYSTLQIFRCENNGYCLLCPVVWSAIFLDFNISVTAGPHRCLKMDVEYCHMPVWTSHSQFMVWCVCVCACVCRCVCVGVPRINRFVGCIFVQGFALNGGLSTRSFSSFCPCQR